VRDTGRRRRFCGKSASPGYCSILIVTLPSVAQPNGSWVTPRLAAGFCLSYAGDACSAASWFSSSKASGDSCRDTEAIGIDVDSTTWAGLSGKKASKTRALRHKKRECRQTLRVHKDKAVVYCPEEAGSFSYRSKTGSRSSLLYSDALSCIWNNSLHRRH
jgi:hypothetical protein